MDGTRLPLSVAQHEIWLAEQLNPKGRQPRIGEYLEICGPIDTERFEAALRRTIAEAEPFRVRFGESEGVPWQTPDVGDDWIFPVLDISAEDDPMAVAERMLLGRYDDEGGFQYVGRTTTLARATGAVVAGLLAAGERERPWTGWSFSVGWGSREQLDVTLVKPELVVEVGVDVARDAFGQWRHPARWHRARRDLSPTDIPHLTSPPR